MSDSAARLRAHLSEALRAALGTRDRQTIATIRSVMAALDNAGAVPMTDQPAPQISSGGDVPRKYLNDADVAAVLRAEIAERRAAADDYARRGQHIRAGDLRESAVLIEGWLHRFGAAATRPD